MYTVLQDVNETGQRVGFDLVSTLTRCAAIHRMKTGWFGQEEGECPEDNLDELRRREAEKFSLREKAKRMKLHEKQEKYKKNMERAEKMEIRRIEGEIRKEQLEKQEREKRRVDRELALRQQARLVTWRQGQAKMAQAELNKAVKSQEKFFATAGGVDPSKGAGGCYEEGQKHIRGQKPC